MKKVLAGLFVTMVAALSALSFAPAAQAAECEGQGYGDNEPKVCPAEITIEPKRAEASPTGILPNTGGPDGVLLIGGTAMLAVGGAAVVVARRRQTH